MIPPEGFAPHERRSPVTAAWEPIFARVAPDCFALGLVVAEAHCNSRGFLHGGVIAALADNAMGLTCVQRMQATPGREGTRFVTVSLSVDYVASGRIGQWLEIAPRLIRAGGAMGFADALATADGAVIARASATFRAS